MLKITTYIKNPRFFGLAMIKKIQWLFSDKVFLKLRYTLEMGRPLNLINPKRFTEKIQWLKLYNRQLEYTVMVDKFAVKEYVGKIIGKQYVIPTIGIWEKANEIDFDNLPDRFVLKTTHSGGSNGVIICRDRSSFDLNISRKKLEYSLSSNIYPTFKEWPYKNVPKRIIAEEFIASGSEYLTDYKIYCFNGDPLYCQVIRNRSVSETIDFFDTEWRHMPFYGLNPNVKQAAEIIPRPLNYDKMLEIASKLSTNIPFLRVDLYNIDGKIYFGEMTFYPASGFGRFTPDEWDYKLGEMLKLPPK